MPNPQTKSGVLPFVVTDIDPSRVVPWLWVEDGEGEDAAEADTERDEPAGDLLQAPQRAAEEGLRALGALRRRDRPHHLLRPRQALRVRHLQPCSYEAANVVKKMEHLEPSIWKILGEKLESCSLEELHELEGKLEKGLCNMRRKKYQLIEEQLPRLQEKENRLAEEENALLREKGT